MKRPTPAGRLVKSIGALLLLHYRCQMGWSRWASGWVALLAATGCGCGAAAPRAPSTDSPRCRESSARIAEAPPAVVPRSADAPSAPATAEPAAQAEGPLPAPDATDQLGSVPFAEDFEWSPFTDDELRSQAYRAIEGAVVPESGLASTLACGSYRASVVEDPGTGEPRAPGLPAIGSLVLGTDQGQTRAVFAPTRPGMRWWLVACADLSSDRTPELVATNFATTLVLGLGAGVATLYEGANPFPERDEAGHVVLHARDRRLHTLQLGMPGTFVPYLPTYWALDGKRFVNRTTKETARMQRQRQRALQVAAACVPADAFCQERLAAFFAGTAVLMGDASEAAAMLTTEAQRRRFRELLALLAKGTRR